LWKVAFNADKILIYLVAVNKDVNSEGKDVVEQDFLVAVENLEGFADARSIHHTGGKHAVGLCAKCKR